MTGIVLFAVALMFLFFGYSVAFTFAGISLIVGVLSLGTDLFAFMPYRIMSIMENTTLMAIPMFIFMGIVLQKTGLAEKLLESSAKLFGQVAGGLAISTIIVGALLAASTGVVGASVVAMGVISLPVMLKNNYHQPTATGVICASGTLGQIIPPSIILIILGDVMGVPVGDLFKAAILPGFLLILMYTLYILVLGKIKPEFCPPMVVTESKQELLIQALKDIVPPMLLIITVLGSIFGGIATPTESSAIGAVGAVILATCYGKFSFKMINDVSKESVKVSSMIFAVLLGATAFSMVFTYSGSDFIVEDFFMDLPGGQWTFILSAMVAILILGFFIDFIEIAFLVVPILTPIAMALDIDLIWFAILITMNLQTSFLTPPFGFSLFYLKGVAPKSIKTLTIYKGVIPFILMQLVILSLVLLLPGYLIIT
ncbi:MULTISPECIES: TRAP transporter large permease subunit [unclassified Colwellia]|uniref:TRAP transporter large permease n=1 Tax=unclassified Colwellia TaxID=196834 RepID=UPI0015F39F17|nr:MULTISPECIES: TRAP transporter large permease subunit [unclassified Colwellia]MBA6224903.1 TRAP transporter large permease subunit [Colwellia sp. MB3u-45]MBA6268809.1 TRAP transporter large permease subunit [Colwellia sp. MB3u-43]MBA6289132.1 TRAP transporter large permease subunit [Colwellia sp. MB3u-4]MBA6296270.1 TRAP transporter large permease subunit [Colwellia sp. MB02u-9]MBA6321240.1 TRAP transporter large permease subunit [Colwellia sp. MB02u-19]